MPPKKPRADCSRVLLPTLFSPITSLMTPFPLLPMPLLPQTGIVAYVSIVVYFNQCHVMSKNGTRPLFRITTKRQAAEHRTRQDVDALNLQAQPRLLA